MATDSKGHPGDGVQFEQVSQELHALFEYSPSTLIPDARHIVKTDVPFWLYDKHLDSRLDLLHVKPLSTLPESLAAVADAALERLVDRGIRLPKIGRSVPGEATRREKQPLVTGSDSVASYYRDTTAISCVAFASMLEIHPRAPTWMNALDWDMFPDWSHSWSWEDEFSLRLKYNLRKKTFYFSKELLEFLDDETLKTLENAATRLPDMATWLIGPVSRTTENVLRDMDKFISTNDFKSKIPSTTGLPPPITTVLAESPDALSSPWGIGERSFDDTYQMNRSSRERASVGKQPRRSARLQRATLTKGTSHARKNAKTSHALRHDLGSRKLAPSPPYDEFVVFPGAEDTSVSETGRLLQHAWAQSVRKDTSLIIFHCGNFERIGVRHRKSQTLYLSDLIDVVNIKNPSYGKLHLGLYIAAFRDTLDRAAQLRHLKMLPLPPSPEGTNAQRRKRRSEDNPIFPNKRARQKDETMDPTPHDIDDIFYNAGLRDLAVFQFQYGVYNSTSPSSFLRVENSLLPPIRKSRPPRLHRKYLPKEYFKVSIFSSIGDGSTGIIHSARLEFNTSDHRSMSCDVVVKFAFTTEQQRRLRHEYSTYAHLVNSGVTGVIVGVLGLFQDIEGGPLALIMSHGGLSLADRGEQTTSVQERKSERTAFLRAVELIHGAGVRHDDLRAPNLLIKEGGSVTILDFDIASLDAPEGTRRRELVELGNLLDEIYGLESDTTTSETSTSTRSSTEMIDES